MAKMAALYDDFAFKNTSKWQWGSNAAVSGGNLVCAVNSGYSGQITSLAGYDLTASEFVVQLEPRSNAAPGQVMVGLFPVGEFNVNSLQWIKTADKLRGYHQATGTYSLEVELTYDPVQHAWLRIREAAGTVYWDTSPDHVTWTQRALWSTPSFPLTGLQARLTAGTPTSIPTDPTPAIFDNVNPDGQANGAGANWFEWNGTTAQPLTFLGVWDGTTAQPATVTINP